MEIDSRNGTILLPGGLALHGALKRDAFLAAVPLRHVHIDVSAAPWYSHSFADGDFEGRPLGFTALFYENPASRESALTECHIHTSRRFDPATGMYRDEGHSPAGDAADMAASLRLLESLLGRPHRFGENLGSWEAYPVLQRNVEYEFPWGTVWCGFEDIHTELVDTSIGLRYIANVLWAHDDCARGHPQRRGSW